jgi:hypothetical protein
MSEMQDFRDEVTAKISADYERLSAERSTLETAISANRMRVKDCEKAMAACKTLLRLSPLPTPAEETE